MATAAPTQNLPLFYNAVEPLNSTQHGKMKVRTILRMPQVAQTHAIPVTVDELASFSATSRSSSRSATTPFRLPCSGSTRA